MLLRAGGYLPLENIAGDPVTRFRVRPGVWARVIADAEVVYHSHPTGELVPSERDMRAQLATGLAWCVVPAGGDAFWWGPGVPTPPLLRRPYRWGVTDCYACVRDVYRVLGIELRDYPRAWGWWRDPAAALFDRYLEAEGFETVSGALAELEPGDGLLFAPRGGVATHAAVYLGGGELLHHPGLGRPYDPTRIPRRDRLERWHRYLTRAVRHVA